MKNKVGTCNLEVKHEISSPETKIFKINPILKHFSKSETLIYTNTFDDCLKHPIKT